MTLFDLIAIVILLVSGLIGFTRGAVRELVTVFAFTLAAMAALYLLPIVGPLIGDHVKPVWAANAVAVVVVFLAAFIALRVAAHALTKRLHETALGAVDRTIGLGFGIVRALVFLGVFYLAFNVATPPELLPRWISEAKLYPLARGSAEVLRVVLPKAWAQRSALAPVLDRMEKEGQSPLEQAGDAAAGRDPASSASQSRSGNSALPGKGYDKRSRDGIDALVERSR
jgi:membrane protein required for colicin V production